MNCLHCTPTQMRHITKRWKKNVKKISLTTFTYIELERCLLHLPPPPISHIALSNHLHWTFIVFSNCASFALTTPLSTKPRSMFSVPFYVFFFSCFWCDLLWLFSHINKTPCCCGVPIYQPITNAIWVRTAWWTCHGTINKYIKALLNVRREAGFMPHIMCNVYTLLWVILFAERIGNFVRFRINVLCVSIYNNSYSYISATRLSDCSLVMAFCVYLKIICKYIHKVHATFIYIIFQSYGVCTLLFFFRTLFYV